MLSHYTSEYQRDWDIFRPNVLFAYRANSQATTLKSPFELLYNHLPNLPSNLDLQRIKPDQRALRRINEIWNMAKKQIYQAGVRETNRPNQKYKSIEYRVGDLIRLHSPSTKIGLKTKLRNEIWHGPFEIINVYDNGNVDILINTKIRRVHMNRINPAESQRIGSFLFWRSRLSWPHLFKNWTRTIARQFRIWIDYWRLPVWIFFIFHFFCIIKIVSTIHQIIALYFILWNPEVS
jgi:hypothetical protein